MHGRPVRHGRRAGCKGDDVSDYTQQIRDSIDRRDIERAATYYRLPEVVLEDETAKLESVRKTVIDALDGQLALFSLAHEGTHITKASDDGVPHMRMVLDFSLTGWADEWSAKAVADALVSAAAEILRGAK